jgi:hypothetical protein
MLNLFEIRKFTAIIVRVWAWLLVMINSHGHGKDIRNRLGTDHKLLVNQIWLLRILYSMNQFQLRGKNMFKTFIKAAVLSAFVLVIGVPFAAAQDDTYKAEFYGGYMYKRTTETPTSNVDVSTSGFNASYTGVMSRSIGGKFDFAISKKDGLYTSTYNGGIEFKNYSTDVKATPFVHILAGYARETGNGGTANGVNLVVGGGLDVRASDRVSIRVIQADYNPFWWAREETLTGKRTNTFRLGMGFVFH